MCEAGAGGGHGDLNQQNELEIDDLAVFAELMKLCSDKLKFQPQLLKGVEKMLIDAMRYPRKKISLDGTELGVDLGGQSQQDFDLSDLDDIPLNKIVPALAKVVTRSKQETAPAKKPNVPGAASGLPKQIRFPYSRHSSYSELCMLIEAFKPNDIYPCTVDHRNWNPKQSMEYLFGHVYGSRPPTFSHDQIMLQHYSDKAVAEDDDGNRFPKETPDFEEDFVPRRDAKSSRSRSFGEDGRRRRPSMEDRDDREEADPKRRKTRAQGSFWPPVGLDHYSPPRKRKASDRERSPLAESRRSSDHRGSRPSTRERQRRQEETKAPTEEQSAHQTLSPTRHINEWRRNIADDHRQRSLAFTAPPADQSGTNRQSKEYGRLSPAESMTPDLVEEGDSAEWDEDDLRLAIQHEAYDAALGKGKLDWSEIGLVSVSGYHQTKEEEL